MQQTKSLWIAGTLALSGCVAIGPEPESGVSVAPADGVACASENDCAEKWQRAEAWLRVHSYWPIRTRGDAVIETERPRSRQYVRTYYRVTRTPHDGGALIRMQASCHPSVYCVPDPKDAQVSFYRYLSAGEDPRARP